MGRESWVCKYSIQCRCIHLSLGTSGYYRVCELDIFFPKKLSISESFFVSKKRANYISFMLSCILPVAASIFVIFTRTVCPTCTMSFGSDTNLFAICDTCTSPSFFIPISTNAPNARVFLIIHSTISHSPYSTGPVLLTFL